MALYEEGFLDTLISINFPSGSYLVIQASATNSNNQPTLPAYPSAALTLFDKQAVLVSVVETQGTPIQTITRNYYVWYPAQTILDNVWKSNGDGTYTNLGGGASAASCATIQAMFPGSFISQGIWGCNSLANAIAGIPAGVVDTSPSRPTNFSRTLGGTQVSGPYQALSQANAQKVYQDTVQYPFAVAQVTEKLPPIYSSSVDYTVVFIVKIPAVNVAECSYHVSMPGPNSSGGTQVYAYSGLKTPPTLNQSGYDSLISFQNMVSDFTTVVTVKKGQDNKLTVTAPGMS